MVRHTTQPTHHRDGRQLKPDNAFSNTSLSAGAKPFFSGSSQGSSASSGTVHRGEASDVSSAGSTASSPQASSAGERFCPLSCFNTDWHHARKCTQHRCTTQCSNRTCAAYSRQSRSFVQYISGAQDPALWFLMLLIAVLRFLSDGDYRHVTPFS